jgi:cupin 2 domain-containing protein
MMSIAAGNIFADIPTRLAKEQFVELLATPRVRIERIVSTGQTTPAGQFYDQDWAEWVLVLQGSATVSFEGESKPRLLRPGDYLHIPPHARHRVELTDPERPTVWIAVHFPPGA